MTKRTTLKWMAASAVLACASTAWAQDTIKIANVVELSGGGASPGTYFRDGIELAVKEINAAGGILGKKIATTTADTQTNPGVAKGLTQKAIDDGAFAIFGPVYSGSIMVSMAESRRAETPNWTGGEAAAITAQGNPYVFRTAFGQSFSFPKLAKYLTGKYKSIAVIYQNNDFGKGGRDAILNNLKATANNIVRHLEHVDDEEDDGQRADEGARRRLLEEQIGGHGRAAGIRKRGADAADQTGEIAVPIAVLVGGRAQVTNQRGIEDLVGDDQQGQDREDAFEGLRV